MYNKPRGFTLIELLVVIAIIALLVSILMPSLAKAREVAKGASCVTNLKNFGTYLYMYRSESNDILPGYSPGFNTTYLPEAGQTIFALEVYRLMGGDMTKFPDSRAVAMNIKTASLRTWVPTALPFTICPNNKHPWGIRRSSGSYGLNTATWHYSEYVVNKSSPDYDIYYPLKTQYFNFGRMKDPAGSILLSELLWKSNYESEGDLAYLGNAFNPGYYNSDALTWNGPDIRYAHPGGTRVTGMNGVNAWEGTNSYLFFDGHVTLRQFPPYQFDETALAAGTLPAGVDLPLYKDLMK